MTITGAPVRIDVSIRRYTGIAVWRDRCAAGRGRLPSKVYTAADIHQDLQFHTRDMNQQHVLPNGQPITLPGIVPKLSATPGQTNWVDPELGQYTDDTDEVLASIGCSPE